VNVVVTVSSGHKWGIVSCSGVGLACAGCGGRLRLLATIEDPTTVTKILAHLDLPTEGPVPIPARALDPASYGKPRASCSARSR